MQKETKNKLLLILLAIYLCSTSFSCSDNNEKKYKSTYTRPEYKYVPKESNKVKRTSTSAYDKGYDDVIENEDYDDKRYDSDSDYADGVDDAMEDWDEEFPNDKDAW